MGSVAGTCGAWLVSGRRRSSFRCGLDKRSPRGPGLGMNRGEILDTAKHYVTVDRAATHGDAERSFGRIAGHWTWWLQDKLRPGMIVTDYDVAQMMVGLKQARAKENPGCEDSHVDEVGYASIAGELASND